MAHFAQLNDDNIVTQVLVTDSTMPNAGHDWLVDNFGGRWVRTSYTREFRKNYAGVGYTYDEIRDAFIPPRPDDTWTLDEDLCIWVAPEVAE